LKYLEIVFSDPHKDVQELSQSLDACSINDTFLRLLRLPEVWLAQQKAMKWSRTTHGMTLILASFGGMIV